MKEWQRTKVIIFLEYPSSKDSILLSLAVYILGSNSRGLIQALIHNNSHFKSTKNLLWNPARLSKAFFFDIFSIVLSSGISTGEHVK